MPVTRYLLVLLIAASGTLFLSEAACWFSECRPIETMHAFAAVGVPMLMLYAILTLGLLYRLAIVLEPRHGRACAALYPSAVLSTAVALGFTDNRHPLSGDTLELVLCLFLPWFAAAIGGLTLRARG
ncbi:hypothetical protein OPU71_08800 [Niveibacterium sp. 24ML]|uniref:hypothetical protein n=1 Tax=Niveibacterium sp. 24ML TaxID=2985512 RepID=UPI0022720EA7|nr:hypothetical protein [Niveibacterium sp. 24ML]MCX9156218.1 hypothetical protein [Niveibacterium sp. 24ML]